MILHHLFLLVLVFILSIEKIKLSWEISTLYNNNENLKVEFENLKDLNLKLTTQFHVENSPANIEKIAKEDLGMIKKRPKKVKYELHLSMVFQNFLCMNHFFTFCMGQFKMGKLYRIRFNTTPGFYFSKQIFDPK